MFELALRLRIDFGEATEASRTSAAVQRRTARVPLPAAALTGLRRTAALALALGVAFSSAGTGLGFAAATALGALAGFFGELDAGPATRRVIFGMAQV